HFQVRSESDTPITAGLRADRLMHPAQGLFGGKAGAPGVVLLNGTPQHPKQTVILRAGDVLTFRTPGGGGYGDPRERASDRLAEDRSSGLVSGGEAMPMLDVCVVGAGAAGIVAARELVRAALGVRVFEARGRVGGRAWTDHGPFGVPIDRGCAWLHNAPDNPWT